MSLSTDFTSCNACSAGCIPPTKHTCWRRDTDSESDEEPPPAKKQRITDPQTSRTGGAHDGGQQFEIKMAAVIGLRGMERGDKFQLATNVKDAGNFDDLVYTANGRRYYLQLKHTENPDTTYLQPKDLAELLHKCFESYYEMEDKDKSEFIIYTNKRRGRTLLSHEKNQVVVDTVERVFKTSTEGEIFNFTRNNKNKKIDVYSGVENLVKKSKEFGDLSVPEQNDKVSMINEFLEKLIMVIGQKGQQKLDKVIYEEIKKRDEIKVGREVYGQVIRYFKTRLEIWWRNKGEKMTPETLRNWLQEAKTKACAPVVRSLFKSCTKTLVSTGMSFSDRRLQSELSDKRAVHLRSDALILCSILLLDCLHKSKAIFVNFESLQSDKKMLLHAWLGGRWEWLIVFCESAVEHSNISDMCIRISEIIKTNNSTKRVIILTVSSVEPIGNFVPIEHIFNFQQLSEESQQIVQDKKIDFQGCEVTLRSVLQRHGNVEHVLGPELVTELITEGTAVNIGGRLQGNEGYYALRELETYIWLHSNVLQNSSDVFFVSGTTEKDLLKIVPSGKTVERVWIELFNRRDFTQDMRGRIFLLSDEDPKNSVLAIGEKIQGMALHWVEFRNGDLLWKMSRGGTDTLLHYIDADKTRADERIITEWMKSGSCEVNEDSIWDLCERTVLVVAEPGMGKSSTTTQVAWNKKERDPTSWVVRINWNDHTRKLQDIDEAKFNFDSLVEFLCSAAFPEPKYTDIERSLLKQALQDSENVKQAPQNSVNVTVLMDGFDEISPTYADKANVILSELMKTRVEKVWVTSRPVAKETLERKLSVSSFGMNRLSRASQIEMLRNLWNYKAGEKEEGLNNFLRSLNRSVYDKDFTGSPLYIKMIATVYETEMNLKSEDWQWPEIDIVSLYEVFVEKKLRIFLTEKQNADITKSSALDILDVLRETLFNTFEKCALVAMLPPTVLESLHDKKIEEEIQPFLAKVQGGKDKTGIVTNVVDGKPQFVHRTFGEFFTARWFSRNFKDNRIVLEDILFDRTYWFMTDMFDKMLVSGFPLHFAVTDSDRKSLDTLLEEGRGVNALDKGGRTFTHLVAKHKWISSCITRSIQYEVSFEITDAVLQWTPLQYAIKSENWLAVELLLRNNVDRSGLDMIRQRAQDRDYINPIIIHAVQYSYLSLLEFLCSIGVNIHQASTRDFPSPLHATIRGAILPVIRLLIKHGADCNTRYSNGQTLLFYAVRFAVCRGSLDVVRTLVEEGGASLDIRDDDGNTAIDWAKKCEQGKDNESKRATIVQYLEERVCKNHEGTSEK